MIDMRNMLLGCACCVVVCLVASFTAAAAEPEKKPVKDYDLTVLEHFKQKTDTESLMKYLADHSADDEGLLAIPDLIKQLGSDKFKDGTFASKKLIALGLLALWPLRDAMSDKDPERARMAKLTLDAMDRGTHAVSVPPYAIRAEAGRSMTRYAAIE